MKTKLLFLGLLVSIFSFGQMKDLLTLSEGKIVYSSTLYDSDENLYGYFYLYEKSSNEKEANMEFVILDKNLNEVSNGTFTSNKYEKVMSDYYDCTMMGDYIILNKAYFYVKPISSGYSSPYKLLLVTFQTLSLKDNTVSDEFTYEEGKLTEFAADYSRMKEEYKGNETKYIVSGFDNGTNKGFFITESNKKTFNEKGFRFFNEKMESVWNFDLNENATKNNYNNFSFLHLNNNTLYISVAKVEKEILKSAAATEFKIVALDLKTGKIKYEYVIENKDSKYTHNIRLKEYDGKLYITGSFYPNKSNNYTLDLLGIYRITLDENGKEISKNYLKWFEFSKFLKISYDGKMKGGYYMNFTKFFIMKDGSISLLVEKVKNGYGDFVLFNMDKDFLIESVNEMKKPVNYYESDFHFSQYIKDNTGVIFFYRYNVPKAKKGEAKVQLAINTIIDGKLTEEKIPLFEKKKYRINPYPAKEGYIMLREYNEDNKYNQLRLEKLNYE